MHACVARHVLACVPGCLSWATGSGAFAVYPAFAQLAQAVQVDCALLEGMKCPVGEILVADFANPNMPMLIVEVMYHWYEAKLA